MKTIRWKSEMRGTMFVGFVGDTERFVVDNLELYDKATSKRYKTYKVGGKDYGKILAKEILNEINVEENEKIRLQYKKDSKIEGDRVSKLIADGDALIAKLQKGDPIFGKSKVQIKKHLDKTKIEKSIIKKQIDALTNE